ncbi:Gfo/Idh/MocA family oxidoreductase [Paenibacillus sp. SYP-B3998]|uniref:Gfo/Idh/MocA family oxidoreductase n=2 Tax=Paenibacillus sp. SYP-B3998 TaxID=2678564 RepID=A0A6G3ZW51_9BACL|nr:Gfo/Idh/MocA family oxidoreductase [Paenibacillus sp. SYP-B3998]
MNVLIIGLGYAGTRFYNAFNNLELSGKEKIEIAYVGRRHHRQDLIYYTNIAKALEDFKPQIIVVSVNDGNHGEVIRQLNGYTGFVICEKPFAGIQDNLDLLESSLKNTVGFCLDLVERYSDATIALKQYVNKGQLRLLRANFYWGKDRIHDLRPTSGVISEIIHPLDLVQWICAPEAELELKESQGIRSDFSISGDEVLDSASITGVLQGAVVTGYSSFVNIIRKREIDLVFASPDNRLVYAALIYDTPAWDFDQLRVWEKTVTGDRVILDIQTGGEQGKPELRTIGKLIRLTADAAHFVQNGKNPSQPFADLRTALNLQNLLNRIERSSRTLGPVQYVVGAERESYYDESNWERLG